MSLKPLAMEAARCWQAEQQVHGLIKVYLELGRIEQENKSILGDVSVVATGIDLNRRLVVEQARILIEPFFLLRRCQLHPEIKYWKCKFELAIAKENANIFECKDLWWKLFQSVMIAYMYGIYICNDVFESLQNYHIGIFGYPNQDLDTLHKENVKIISLPSLRVQLCGMDPVTFGQVPSFEKLDEKEEKDNLIFDMDDFLRRGLGKNIKEMNEKNQASPVSLDEHILQVHEGKQEVGGNMSPLDLDMDGMYPETYLGELSNC